MDFPRPKLPPREIFFQTLISVLLLYSEMDSLLVSKHSSNLLSDITSHDLGFYLSDKYDRNLAGNIAQNPIETLQLLYHETMF